jgi:S-adenosylmethionine/arginine decarboxylase-like enzyme
MLDFKNISTEYLLDPTKMMKLVKEALKLTDCAICDQNQIIYPDEEGYTFLFLLSESHLSIHTMPKTNSFSMDFYNVN